MSSTLRNRIDLRLADRELEKRLYVLDSLPSEGVVALRLERPLGIRASCEVEGFRTDIITAMDGDDVVGFATRAERLAYVNGRSEPQVVGLLGNLRIHPDFRSTMTLARGLRVFDALDDMGDARFSLAFVQEENTAALKLFEGRRLLLPDFTSFGRLDTYFLRQVRAPRTGFSVRRASENDLRAIAAFQRRCGRRRQFFPHYGVDDLSGRTNRLRGLRPEDIFLCYADDRLVGTAARWSQRSFRSWRVERYNFPLSLLRPVYNTVAPFVGRMRLPEPGERFAYDFLSLVCIENDDPFALRALLGAMSSDVPLVVSVHERDPLRPVFRRESMHTIRSRIYVVHRSGRRPALDTPVQRAPYIEGGTI